MRFSRFLWLHFGLAEAFACDDDGNLLHDGTFDYTWDAGTLDATANAKR
ncbi:MAG TPA: hypothetical protein PLL20_07595 [Phycisphaerae bacterium]|nr:hypothetical protein [Phycisphaerae bacterium]